MRLIRLTRLALSVALGTAALFAADSFAFVPVPKAVVEERVQAYSTKPSERRDGLRRLFEAAGCVPPSLTEQAVKYERLGNVICTLSGLTDSKIVVGAHYDHHRGGAGVIDNWSGASLLASLYQSLAGRPRKHTILFIGFTAEEVGLRGSGFFVRTLTKDERANFRAVVNLDSLGLSSTKVWASRSDAELARALYAVAETMGLPVAGVNMEQVGSGDGQSFRLRKIPIIDIHSVTQQTLRILHSPQDGLPAIRSDDYYDTYRLIAGYLAYLDLKLE